MDNPAPYDLAGPAGAPAIVFLHGMRVTRRMWQPQIAPLARSYRVIAIDLPGHGAQRNQIFNLDAAVRQIAEIIDREARGRALLVGLSLGGYIAMEFGASYPEKTAGLVIASASVEPSGWYNLPYRILAVIMDRAPENLLNWISRTFFEFVYPHGRAEPLVAPGFFMRGGSQGLREVFHRKFQPRLAAYPGPVLLLNGSRDLGFRMHERRFLAAAQHARLEILPRAFHIANIDQPAAFTDAVLRFAQSLQLTCPP